MSLLSFRNFILGAALFNLLVQANARAANVPYVFGLKIDSGPLSGIVYPGSFVFDDVTHALTGFEFFFQGSTYTELDDPSAQAVFSGSTFVGLSYSVVGSGGDPDFSFIPGTSDLSQSYFAYDLNLSPPALTAGTGELKYQLVPAPLALPAAVVGFSYTRRIRKRIRMTL
jgi:hypothetical protein